jgi:hypothetical protein
MEDLMAAAKSMCGTLNANVLKDDPTKPGSR